MIVSSKHYSNYFRPRSSIFVNAEAVKRYAAVFAQ